MNLVITTLISRTNGSGKLGLSLCGTQLAQPVTKHKLQKSTWLHAALNKRSLEAIPRCHVRSTSTGSAVVMNGWTLSSRVLISHTKWPTYAAGVTIYSCTFDEKACHVYTLRSQSCLPKLAGECSFPQHKSWRLPHLQKLLPSTSFILNISDVE